jgi:glyoxylase I family protein
MKYKIEHFAFNVSDPVAMAAWYEKHIGFEIVRKIEAANNTHFLMDNSGSIMIEVYNNPPDQVPNYKKMDPLQIHLALVSDDPDADKNMLLDAGASFVEEIHLPDGSHLVMLRDPWGLALQLCKRGRPMLR